MAAIVVGLTLPASVLAADPALVAASTASATLDVSWTRADVAGVLHPPEAIRVGDTLTIAPTVEGLTSYKCVTGLLRDGFDEFQVSATSMDTAGTPDVCTPWTVTVAPTTPGPVSVSLLVSGLGPPEDQATIRAPNVELSLESGGSPVPFSSNYPVTSWALADLLSDATPTFGSTLTLPPPETATSDCEFGLNGEWWSTIWSPDEPVKTCEPWSLTIPEMRPPWARETVPYGAPWRARAEIRGAASDPATGRSLYGTTSSVPIPFGVGSATFSSSRPAAVLDHDLNPRHAHPGPYVVRPRLAGVTSGTCRYEWKLPNGDYTSGPEIPVADGSCGSAEFDATDIGVHQFWVYVVDDLGRQITVAAAGVNIDPPMPAPVVEVPTDAEAGTDVPIDASVGAGAPTGYEVAVTPTSTTIASYDAGTFEVVGAVSISAAGPACSGATGALDPRKGSASITATCRFAAGGRYQVVASFTDAAGVVRSSATRLVTVADVAGPSGSVAIAGGRTFTKSTAVTLAVPASDPDGVSQVRLSNGTTWATRPYAASQTWTLPATNGTRTVYVQWKDTANNWSAIKTDTIVLDTVAPTATAPRRGLVANTSIDAGRITLRVPWSGSDATSGIARYELLQSTDGGAWTTVSTTLTGPTVDRSLASLHTYRFRVRAIDKAGNVGAWVFGSTFRLSRYSEFNSAIRYSAPWATVSSPAYWGGAAKRSGTAGARATLTFTGRAAAWVARTGPNRGVASVYVNGTRVATIDLSSPTYHNQRVVWARNWSTSAARTITIRVAGTSGHPLVDLDAFVTAN